jgi:hypothetical protein
VHEEALITSKINKIFFLYVTQQIQLKNNKKKWKGLVVIQRSSIKAYNTLNNTTWKTKVHTPWLENATKFGLKFKIYEQ